VDQIRHGLDLAERPMTLAYHPSSPAAAVRRRQATTTCGATQRRKADGSVVRYVVLAHNRRVDGGLFRLGEHVNNGDLVSP
jgi:hypothetical protein